MNAALITDLEIIMGMIEGLSGASTSETVAYEIAIAKAHFERAIEWEKIRP